MGKRNFIKLVIKTLRCEVLDEIYIYDITGGRKKDVPKGSA